MKIKLTIKLLATEAFDTCIRTASSSSKKDHISQLVPLHETLFKCVFKRFIVKKPQLPDLYSRKPFGPTVVK